MPLSSRIFCLLLGLAGPALAQAASLAVAVIDGSGQPVPDAVVMLEGTSRAQPAVKPMPTVEISQAKREFAPRMTVVTVGTPVSFPNRDTVRHHVYSFSPIKTFELKLYEGVPAKPIVFDKPGIAVLGCNIHDRMAAWVVVVDTPYHARTGTDGQAQFDGVPPGDYRLRGWHAGIPVGQEPASVAVTVGTVDGRALITLPAAPQ